MIAFISHNKKDVDVAREIALFLVAEEVGVWFDEWEIAAGDSIVEKINDGLRDASHFFILWSINSNRSNWVRRELNSTIMRAIEEKTPRIIPVVLDKTPLPELLADLKYIRYHSGTEEDRSNIVSAVIGRRPKNDFIKAIVKKYQEVIRAGDDSDNPFGLKACPQCGSTRLKYSNAIDYQRDKMYHIINCLECNWNDWSQ